ncbi:MAG: hypothetical protein WHS77_03205 [Brevinematales bacterium]
MPDEKIELLDDFLVDMDIETITIDKNDERAFLETEELDEEEIESSGDLNELSKATGVEIENLNISGGGGVSGGPSDIKAETVNIYQQAAPINVSGGNVSSGGVSGGISGGQAVPTQELSKPEVFGGENFPSQASQSQPQGFGGGSVPPNITFENVTFEIKDANIKVDKSEIKAESVDLTTEDSNLSIDAAELLKEPEEELITISETDLNDIIEENTVDLDKLAEETESEFTSPEGIDTTGEISEEVSGIGDIGETIDELEKVEEPSIPEQDELKSVESELDKIPEESKGITEEDSIVSIDGNELDNLIYGSELSKYVEEKPEEEIKFEEPESIPEQKFEKPVEFELEEKEVAPVETPQVFEEAVEPTKEEDFGGVGFDNIDEIKLEEIPLEEINISPEESSEIPIIEEEKQEEEPVAIVEEEKEELISPEKVEEEMAKEEDFTFDLSVIPDVAEVEEDEPIALSLEELNNIEVSEESIEERMPSSEGENIEIAVDELSSDVELKDSLKEPASLEVYGTDESEAGLPEGIEIEGIDNIFEEPEPGKSFSESAGVIEDKLESLSPETKEELKTVLKYLDNLLEELPEDKIKEFAKSEYYDLYVKILDKLGI